MKDRGIIIEFLVKEWKNDAQVLSSLNNLYSEDNSNFLKYLNNSKFFLNPLIIRML